MTHQHQAWRVSVLQATMRQRLLCSKGDNGQNNG